MKKLLALSMVVLMFAMLVIPTFAGTVENEVLNPAFEIKKANTAWAADGVISEGEYYKVEAPNTWFSSACADDANDDYAKNLMPDFYMSWDDTYVYWASQYTVKAHDNNWDADPNSMWYSGAVQLNYANAMAAVDDPNDRLEYGIGLSSDTGALLTTVAPGNWDGLHEYDAAAGKDFTITNASNLLTYEVRTPWSVFLDGTAAIGTTFGACYVWSTGVDQDYVHTQLARGCTGFGKDATAFAQVTLAAAPEIVTEAPVVEEAPAEEAPAAQTADMVGIAVLAAVIALAGAAVVSKKRV